MEFALFGPGGNSDSFKKEHSSSLDAPAWIRSLGLDAYEYECGRGVGISDEKARELGARGKREGVAISLHSPYYISLSVKDPERQAKNEKYVLDSCAAVKAMGGERVVVHCGGLSGLSRSEALVNTVDNLKLLLAAMDENGLGDIRLCVETMGKINVLGDLDEVIEICRSDERLWPCVDFGHLNARTLGGIKGEEDFAAVLDALESGLGNERAKSFHCHFSRVEYSSSGEVKHLNFEDGQFGPEPEPLMKLLALRGLTPTVICESAGRQAEDALFMKTLYLKYMRQYV